jgi:hypothetical protein
MKSVVGRLDADKKSPSPYFAYVSADIGIDGSVTIEGLQYLVDNFESAIYLCVDDDAGVDTG